MSELTDLVTIVDLAPLVETENAPPGERAVAAQAVRDSFRQSSCVIVKDPRVSQADNDAFINQMEDYFGRPAHEKMAEVRPELAYQIGATPSGAETPRCCFDKELQAQIKAQHPHNRATMPTGPDVKWRFFWRVGPRPASTEFPELNSDPVVPVGVPNWSSTMNSWGEKLLATAVTVSELLACAYDLPSNTFVDLMHEGPHLLAPTGTDLTEHGKLNTVFAGYHYDLNFLTIHGRSRYPGLFIWVRDGTRVPVRLPPGCILLQAGRQLEMLTGGDILAGMHEVICTHETLAAVERAQREASRPLWRVSSTVFSHVRSDALLAPLPPFRGRGGAYKAVRAGEYVRQELQAIKLAKAVAEVPASQRSAGRSENVQ